MYLGTESATTVFAAELADIFMALSMALRDTQGLRGVRVSTGNKASIAAVADPQRQSGQWMLVKIFACLGILQSKGTSIELHWIPAHIGVE